jgi:hypothetical protein
MAWKDATARALTERGDASLESAAAADGGREQK